MKNKSDWMPQLQAAQQANCHPSYFNAVVNKNAIKSRRIAGRVFVERKSFEAWLELYRVRRFRHLETENGTPPDRVAMSATA